MKIHPYANIFPEMNQHEFSALKDDIKANGLREPILTYERMILDGRNRFKACQELGITPRYREWTENGSAISLVVSLNLRRRHLTPSQVNAIGADVEELYQKEAKERQRASGGDRKSGKAKSNRKSVVTNSSQPSPKAREQAAKEVGGSPAEISKAKKVKKADPKLHEEVKAGTKTLNQAIREVKREEKKAELEAKAKEAETSVFGAGDKKDLGWEIITGDCLEVMGSVEFVKARLIFADPPYNIGIKYGDHYHDARDDDDYIQWADSWIKKCASSLTDDGSLWVLVSDEYAAEYGCLIKDAGLTIRSWIIWYETFGVNCQNKFNRTHRHLFYAVKNPKSFVFNAEAVTRPSDRQTKYGDKRADSAGKIWDDVWGINPLIPRVVDNHPDRIPDFPTQLPLDLLRPIIASASDPGDLVVDPFSGSATCGAACIELGRRFVGVELSEEFATISRKRLLAISGDRKRETA